MKGFKIMTYSSIDSILTEQYDDCLIIESFRELVDLIFEAKNELSEEETQDRLRKYKLDGNIEARNDIILANIPLVYHLAKKMYFSNAKYTWDDLISEGTVSIIKAIDNYDINRNAKFSTYLYTTVHGYLLNFVNTGRSTSASEYSKSLDQELSKEYSQQDKEVIRATEDELSDVSKIIQRSEDLDRLNNIIDKLPDNKKYAVLSYFGLNGFPKLKVQDIAKKLKISTPGASLMIKRALEEIKKAY